MLLSLITTVHVITLGHLEFENYPHRPRLSSRNLTLWCHYDVTFIQSIRKLISISNFHNHFLSSLFPFQHPFSICHFLSGYSQIDSDCHFGDRRSRSTWWRRQILPLQRRVLNIQRRVLIKWRRILDIQRRVLNLQRRVLNIQRRVLNIKRRVSNIQRTVLNIQRRALNTQRRVLNIQF